MAGKFTSAHDSKRTWSITGLKGYLDYDNLASKNLLRRWTFVFGKEKRRFFAFNGEVIR